MVRTLIFLVCLLTTTNNFAVAQQYRVDSLLRILPKQEAGIAHVDALNALAFAYTPVSVSEAEAITKQSIQEAREFNYESGVADAYKILGVIYYVRGEYHLAAQYSYEALNLYEKLADKPGQAKVLNNLSLIFLEEKDFEKAKTFSEQSLKLKRLQGDSVGVGTSYLALAEYYLHRKDYQRAMELCNAARKLYGQSDDLRTSYTYFQFGEIYHALKKYALALTNYYDAMHYATRAKDFVGIINVNKKLGELYLHTNQLDSAYIFLSRARTLAVEKASRNNEMQVNQLLSDYFNVTGKLDSALYYTKTAMSIEREIFNHQKSEQIAMLQMLYNFEKNDRELAFQKKIVRRQYVAIAGVSLILLLTTVLGVKFYKLNKSNQQAKEALLKLNEDVSKMNENLEAMVQERTEKIKFQNQKLVEFTFFTAHEVRGPVARILGLIELSKLDEIQADERVQILKRLEEAGLELDEVIRQINRKMEKGQLKDEFIR
jgi:tetratricopeptide (TPR) repeat protein